MAAKTYQKNTIMSTSNKPAPNTVYTCDHQYELYREIITRIKGPTHMEDLIKPIKVLRHFRPNLIPKNTNVSVAAYIFHFAMGMYRRGYITKVAKYTFDLPKGTLNDSSHSYR